MSDKVKGYIRALFENLNREVSDIINASVSPKLAARQIGELTAGRIAAASRGYMADIYLELSDKTLKEEIFQPVENANKFYALNLRRKISEEYQFDIKKIENCAAEIDFDEVDQLYASVGSAVCSAVAGYAVLKILASIIEIPFAFVIGGSMLAGIGGGAVAYQTVPEINKKRLKSLINSFMKTLENEMFKWVDDIIEFYEQEIQTLKTEIGEKLR